MNWSFLGGHEGELVELMTSGPGRFGEPPLLPAFL